MARVIEIEHLARWFGDGEKRVAALDDVSCVAGQGEILGVVGPNGAGKSTLVLIIGALLAPSSGSVRVDGHSLEREPQAVRRAVGATLQETGLDPRQTGRELLVLQGRLHGLKAAAAAARAGELIELFDLEQHADRLVGTYSGGLSRRLDLALALVHRPRVLLLDEPTTGLDPSSRHAIWDEVRRLRSDGATVLLTTQYLEEADRLADRIAILDAGRIVAEGTPRELKRMVGDEVVELTFEHAERAATVARELGYGSVYGERIRMRTNSGAAEIATLLLRLREIGVEPRTIALSGPTLDDVFFGLTAARRPPVAAWEP